MRKFSPNNKKTGSLKPRLRKNCNVRQALRTRSLKQLLHPAALLKWVQPNCPLSKDVRRQQSQRSVRQAVISHWPRLIRALGLVPPAQFKNVEVKDINGDGVPDLWIYHNPRNPGEIVRQEEATKYDGTVNAWSYFKDGKLVRRDVDSQGLGRPDTVFYYAEDKIAREERDESGTGRISYRATYQNGRLAQIEKDTRGEGKIDFWIHYDTNRAEEIIIKDEKDMNGDGIADLWTYYENGRVVRRDVSAVGLELLAKQEQISLPIADVKGIQIPGN